MGEIVAHEFVTLDGVMQAPGAPDEDREGGFVHGGWQAPYLDEEQGRLMSEHYAGIDALLLGRKTYEIFAGYWPHAPADNPFTAVMNHTPKYVASHTLENADWNNSTLLEGDFAASVARLKEQHDQIQVVGSSGLLQSLLRHDLVDKMNLWIYPVLFGSGKRLFADGTVPAALRVVNSRVFDNGTVLLTFAWAGKPEYGNMAADAG